MTVLTRTARIAGKIGTGMLYAGIWTPKAPVTSIVPDWHGCVAQSLSKTEKPCSISPNPPQPISWIRKNNGGLIKPARARMPPTGPGKVSSSTSRSSIVRQQQPVDTIHPYRGKTQPFLPCMPWQGRRAGALSPSGPASSRKSSGISLPRSAPLRFPLPARSPFGNSRRTSLYGPRTSSGSTTTSRRPMPQPTGSLPPLPEPSLSVLPGVRATRTASKWTGCTCLTSTVSRDMPARS